MKLLLGLLLLTSAVAFAGELDQPVTTNSSFVTNAIHQAETTVNKNAASKKEITRQIGRRYENALAERARIRALPPERRDQVLQLLAQRYLELMDELAPVDPNRIYRGQAQGFANEERNAKIAEVFFILEVVPVGALVRDDYFWSTYTSGVTLAYGGAIVAGTHISPHWFGYVLTGLGVVGTIIISPAAAELANRARETALTITGKNGKPWDTFWDVVRLGRFSKLPINRKERMTWLREKTLEAVEGNKPIEIIPSVVGEGHQSTPRISPVELAALAECDRAASGVRVDETVDAPEEEETPASEKARMTLPQP